MDNKNVVYDKVSEEITKAIISMKKDYLIIDRHIKGDFLSVFKDSLFEYKDGFLLVERFYKISKCKEEVRSFSYMSDEDRKIVENFNNFANEIINSENHKHEDAQAKIDEYQDKIKQIKNQYAAMSIYSYDNKSLLIKLEDVPDEAIKSFADIYTSFVMSFFSSLTWNNLSNLSFTLVTVSREDYIDLIIFPSLTNENDPETN